MKIIKVLVDELPESAKKCWKSEVHFNSLTMKEVIDCLLTNKRHYMSFADSVSTRCPDCPLALEHDNVWIANEVM